MNEPMHSNETGCWVVAGVVHGERNEMDYHSVRVFKAENELEARRCAMTLGHSCRFTSWGKDGP